MKYTFGLMAMIATCFVGLSGHAAEASPLDGTWQTGCMSEGSIYMVATITFSGNQGYGTAGIYSDSTCTQPVPGVTAQPEWLTITIGATDPATGLTQFTDVNENSSGQKTQEYNVFQITNGSALTVGQASQVPGDYPTATIPNLVYKKQPTALPIPPQP